MRRWIAGAAALALAATMAQADPGNGKGKGGGQDGRPAAHGKASPGNAGGGGPGKAAKADRGHGPSAKPDRDRGPNRVAHAPAAKPDRDRGPDRAKGERGDRGDRARAADKPGKPDRRAERGSQHDRDIIRDRVRRADRQVIRGRLNDDRDVRVVRFDVGNRGVIDGCPPGLAKKNNGCMPPGLLKQRDDVRFRQAFYRPDWWGYGSLGDRVYYDDGYLYRLSANNSVLGYIPLLGGALSVGRIWPSMYRPVDIPPYYVDYYNLGPAGSYRYADDVLYRIDPETAAITSIAALLTGDDFAVGQPLPLGYDVYNVPYAYRDRYYDGPDALYRYSDGYIYQVDPETRLIAAVIELLI